MFDRLIVKNWFVLSIIFLGLCALAKPRVGDKKLIKGVMHERHLEMVHDIHGNPIGINKTGGRYHYVWEVCNDN